MAQENPTPGRVAQVKCAGAHVRDVSLNQTLTAPLFVALAAAAEVNNAFLDSSLGVDNYTYTHTESYTLHTEIDVLQNSSQHRRIPLLTDVFQKYL